VKDWTPRQILRHRPRLCTPQCLCAYGVEEDGCACPYCHGALHGLASGMPVEGSGRIVAALLAGVVAAPGRRPRRRYQRVVVRRGDDGALIPLAEVLPAPAGNEQQEEVVPA
jgi:hypothetical protein